MEGSGSNELFTCLTAVRMMRLNFHDVEVWGVHV
jgi:hypothetical protein